MFKCIFLQNYEVFIVSQNRFALPLTVQLSNINLVFMITFTCNVFHLMINVLPGDPGYELVEVGGVASIEPSMGVPNILPGDPR